MFNISFFSEAVQHEDIQFTLEEKQQIHTIQKLYKEM